MSLSASRRTWDEASSPAAVQLARRYEEAWRKSGSSRGRPALADFLSEAEQTQPDPAATRLALLRADMSLRYESGEPVPARWYLSQFSNLGEDTIVALVYEEFCLREETSHAPDPTEFLSKYPEVAKAVGRILEIHDLVGSGTATTSFASSFGGSLGGDSGGGFPSVGETIGGFRLVEELGRGSFARVFLALEQELADRPVALKVTRRGSREPQTLARLQHTHIVPVYSYRVDPSTGLHLLCMPYFGRVTLARILADPRVREADTGRELVDAIDRLGGGEGLASSRPAARAALARRGYPRAVAWWGARLAEALEHAHDRGVLHRDVKPSNVLVTSDAMPMLLDFNLAHDPLLEGGGSTLGGTLDYMAPEHLRALAEGATDSVDARADIYGLGVILHEAAVGKRPFAPPRKGGSIVEALLDAVRERSIPLPSLRIERPEIPPALDAVIRRALEPEPADRYQTAADFAADLHAVAADLPLIHAREPWLSQTTAWVRRRKRKLALVAAVLIAIASFAFGSLGSKLYKEKGYSLFEDSFSEGKRTLENGQFAEARLHFDTAAQLATRFEQGELNHAMRSGDWREMGRILNRVAALLLQSGETADFSELKERALDQATVAERHDQAQRDARAVLAAADGLRFRLLQGKESEQGQAVARLKSVIYPFRVLELENWSEVDSREFRPVSMLEPALRESLRDQVDELLFLWMTLVDRALADAQSRPDSPAPIDARMLDAARLVCRQGLTSSRSPAPWRALIQSIEAHSSRAAAGPSLAQLPFEMPVDPARESSPLACFEWGLLLYREDRILEGIEWLKRAVRLKPDDYWYYSLLGFLEDKAGRSDDALGHYSVAVGLKPASPHVRFNRARLYRARGQWEAATDDLQVALAGFHGSSEADLVRFELGYLNQEQGNFPGARSYYASLIASQPNSDLGRAARLNQANMEADSGRIAAAFREYDALLEQEPRNADARFSRALVALQTGDARRAEIDFTTLLDLGLVEVNKGEVMAARSLARLRLGRVEQALDDAQVARSLDPSPARERLRTRCLLAARRIEPLALDGPDQIATLPLTGPALDADLASIVRQLAPLGLGSGDDAVHALLNQAVALAALGLSSKALDAADRACALSPSSPRALLIRARVKAHFRNWQAARVDVTRGLAVQPDEPNLLELRGLIFAQAGNHRAAIQDFDSAIHRGIRDRAHYNKARSLAALGELPSAVVEFSRALVRDPEFPQAYLGRAQVLIRLRHYDSALADLEQAASWAHANPWLEFEVALAVGQCLAVRPDRAPRFLSLLRRSARDAWTTWSRKIPRTANEAGRRNAASR